MYNYQMMMGQQMPMNNMMGMQMPMNNMNNMNNMMGMNLMNMGNMNMNNMMMMMGGNEDWEKGFKMGVEEVKGSNVVDVSKSNGPKLNVIFNTTQGVTHSLVFDYGTTIDEALKKYLARVNRSDLANSENKNKICFLFNANQVKFGDNTKIEDFFKNTTSPKIVVNDVNNLIGA